MIIKLFRENQIFTVLLTLLLSFLIGFLVILTKSFTPGFSYIYLKSFFALVPKLKAISDYKVLSTLLNILLILLNGYYLSRIIVKYRIIPSRSSLPMFIFFILSVPYFAEYNGFSYPLLTLLILIVSMDMIFAEIELKTISYRFFDSTMLISAASLFNIYFIFFVLFVLIIWIQYRGLKWREFAFIIIGAVVPYLILFAVLYIIGKDISPILYEFKDIFQVKSVIPLSNAFYYILGILGFLTLVGSVQILRDYGKMKIVIRKYSIIFFLLLIIILLITLFFPMIEKDIIFFFALPLSFLLSYYFANCKTSIFNQLLLLALIFGSLATLIF